MPLKSNFKEWDKASSNRGPLDKGLIAEMAKRGSFVAIESTPMYASA